METLRIVTWNVNSIKARWDRLQQYLERDAPDVVCVQELKVTDEKFPTDALSALGYHSAAFGQPTYNGVAILSKTPLTNVRRGLDVEDPQARAIAAEVRGVAVLCLYCPNGQSPESDKFAYKMQWFDHLAAYLEKHYSPSAPLVVCGDFNVAPHDLDCHDPDAWRGQVLFTDQEREKLSRLMKWGLEDTYRRHHPDTRAFSWWDYRMLGFQKNRGMRIDFVLATAPLMEKCSGAEILRDERKGTKPSDHAPVAAEFSVES